MIRIKQINDIKVNPIKVIKHSTEEIQGNALFPRLSCNIVLIAKKESGKTNVINTILKKCINKNTTVIIFCSTIYIDENWQYIVKWLKKHNINHELYTSIYEDGLNLIQQFLQNVSKPPELENGEEEEEKEDENIQKPITLTTSEIIALKILEDKVKNELKILQDEVKNEPKERKPKKIAPNYVIIFDDMSDELKNKYTSVMMKKHRHFSSKIILSSQYYNDVEKQSRAQIDYLLIFRGISIQKLEELHSDLSLNISFEAFYLCYQEATKEKYNFLYIDRNNPDPEKMFRKNFSELMEINKSLINI